MTLLKEIQNEAVDTKSDLGSLLRKCKLLAVRLCSNELEDWLLWESNGYPENIKVPDYRVWRLELIGYFAGPFGSGLKNAPIPLVRLPEKIRDDYKNYQCRQSISSIEQLIKSTDKGTLEVSTGDLAVLLGKKVYKGLNCIQVRAVFGISNLLELLNSVRNRILDFSLAIWKENPGAGESNLKSSAILEPSKITQIFNTTVYGGAANLLGTVSNSHLTFNIKDNDFESLEKALRQNLVSNIDIQELKKALKKDDPPKNANNFGPLVSNWILGMKNKAAEGSWKIGIGVAGSLLAQAIAKYYGF